MTAYARIDPVTNSVRDIVDLTSSQFAALNGNPKQAFLKPLIIDAKPATNSTNVVVSAGYVIEAAQVRQTWALRAKTQAEIDADTQTSELAQLKAMLAALSTDIAAGITAAPTTAAQAFIEIQDLKRRALRADRVLRWLLKGQIA